MIFIPSIIYSLFNIIVLLTLFSFTKPLSKKKGIEITVKMLGLEIKIKQWVHRVDIVSLYQPNNNPLILLCYKSC